jgi:pimeloyl-ACP methyl ester carboxylesterase
MHFRHGTHRPPPPPPPPPDAFAIHKARVRDELDIAWVRAGEGGYPLLLLHGWPETKRIWWRNLEPLAAAGFDVIAPDLRGFGDSDVSAEDRHDLVEYSLDCHALMTEVLGLEQYSIAAGDVGGVVEIDMALRFPESVDRLCFFNSVPPFLGEDYTAAGLDAAGLRDDPTGDYRIWQGERPDELATKLDTEQRRRDWVAAMYGHRLWAAPGTFEQADVDFMTGPFGDADHMRASWACYQLAAGTRETREFPRLLEKVPTRTLLLYGPEDHVIVEDFVSRCEIAFENAVGPIVVPGAGHFLQWERADLFNELLALFLGDLRTGSGGA